MTELKLTHVYDISHVLKHADGTILPTVPEYEPESSKVARKWYTQDVGKELFTVGPQFLPGTFSLDGPPRRTEHPVFAFLDRHPPQSVWFISFGTFYYPSNPEQINALFRELVKSKTPFIHSGASMAFRSEMIPTELRTEIEESGLGLLTSGLVPQQELLTHPSLAAFVTHGGNSSLWESVLAGVIGVFWPFAADQPYHAAYMSTKVLRIELWESSFLD